MKVINTGDKFQRWKYRIDEVVLLFNEGDKINLPQERVVKMRIQNNYKDYFFPVFSISLSLESSIYDKIIKNKNTMKLKLRVKKFYTGYESETKSMERDFINDTFSFILDDTYFDKDEAIRREKNKDDYKNVTNNNFNEIEWNGNVLEFFLFKTEVITRLKKNVNYVYDNTNLSNVIAHLLSDAKITNTLMSPLTNNKVYDTILIPPLKLLDALTFIDNYYGLYNTGSMIFFGLHRNYIIKYDGKCSAYTKDEVKNVTVLVLYPTDPCQVIKLNEDKTKYLTCTSDNIAISNDVISINTIAGADVIAVDNYSGDIDKSDAITFDDVTNMSNIIENNTENDWITGTYTAQTSSGRVVIECLLANFDLNDLEPNKKFNFVFDDTKQTKKYNGEYLLTSSDNLFMKDGNYFILSTSATFQKTK